MSGHSKWSTIKHQKAAADKKRGKLFSRLSRQISVAAREGDDAEFNYKLRSAIEEAQNADMPKENIKKAIKKGAGKLDSGGLESVVYEGYGPEKIAVIVEVITDNKNRTSSLIKSFFEKHNGSLGSPNSVGYRFSKKGIITIEKRKDFENQALQLIDLGVDDFQEGGGIVQVYCAPKKLAQLKKEIEKQGFKVKSTELSFEPNTPLIIKDKQKKEKVLNFLNKLDDLDDVQKIHSNVELK